MKIKPFKRPFVFFLSFFLVFSFFSLSIADLTPEKIYGIAKKRYRKLMVSSPEAEVTRRSWSETIQLFEEVFRRDPDGPLADDSLFSVGNLYRELFKRTGNKTDLSNQIKYYQAVYQKFPKSTLSDDACFLVGEAFFLYQKDYEKAYQAYKNIVDNYPSGDKYISAKIRLNEVLQFYASKAEPGKKRVSSEIKGVRHWANPKYTRIVIDLNNEVTYKEFLLRNPDRIYIDFLNTRLGAEIKDQLIKLEDGLLKSIRIAQHSKETARIVLDIDQISKYKIFALENPFRIVIDVKKEKEEPKKAVEKREEKYTPEKKKGDDIRIKDKDYVKTIVIDPGHGGKDPGAIGYNGLQEKTVVLDIAKRLKAIIRKETRHKVLMTREKDVYLSLEERTAIANTLNADLFISLHANASRRRGATGVETYFLDYTFSEDVLETVARENNAPFLLKDDLQAILYDLKKTKYYNESILLANNVQHSMITHLNSRNSKLKDRGAKAAPFYVLFGAEMPSILVETLFISNKNDEKMLRSERYKQKIAEAIFLGIKNYLTETEDELRARR